MWSPAFQARPTARPRAEFPFMAKECEVASRIPHFHPTGGGRAVPNGGVNLRLVSVRACGALRGRRRFGMATRCLLGGMRRVLFCGFDLVRPFGLHSLFH